MKETFFARRCQECGHAQKAKHPQEYKNDSWRDLKCKKCGSNAMDYGHNSFCYNAEGKCVPVETTDDED